MKTKTRAHKAPTRSVRGGTGKPRQKAHGKKSRGKKATARKTAAKKRAAKKSPAKKPTERKTTARKTSPNEAASRKTRGSGTPKTTTNPAPITASKTTLQEKTTATGAPTRAKAKENPGTNGSPIRLSPRLPKGKDRPSVWGNLTAHLRDVMEARSFRSDRGGAAPDERPIGRWIAAGFLSGCLVGWVLAALL